jgi:hypothetical protein
LEVPSSTPDGKSAVPHASFGNFCVFIKKRSVETQELEEAADGSQVAVANIEATKHSSILAPWPETG